jgi:hypothetical protein
MHIRRRKLPALVMLVVCYAGWCQYAYAQPWIPPVGSGKIKATVRFYHSDRLFPQTSFSTTTTPTHSKLSETQLRIDGDHGLGYGWALVYELRAAQIIKSKPKATYSATGLQDQQIGLSYGLRQRAHFADAITVNAIIPTGRTSTTPQLGTGALAVEPDYEAGVEHNFGSRLAYAGLSVGPRIYVRDGVTQVRASAVAGIGLIRRLTLTGTLFFSKTLASNTLAVSTTPNASEFYNILRGGIGLEYAVTKNVRPVIAYQKDLAGQRIHAGSRLVAGVSWRY